jgi:disulfide oxidoreductase YuzD
LLSKVNIVDMAKGLKTGGRLPGTPNKERRTLLETIEDKYPGYNPVLSLVDIANDPENDINLRFQANKEVAKYISPQLKAVEINILEPQPTVRTFIFKPATQKPN